MAGVYSGWSRPQEGILATGVPYHPGQGALEALVLGRPLLDLLAELLQIAVLHHSHGGATGRVDACGDETHAGPL